MTDQQSDPRALDRRIGEAMGFTVAPYERLRNEHLWVLMRNGKRVNFPSETPAEAWSLFSPTSDQAAFVEVLTWAQSNRYDNAFDSPDMVVIVDQTNGYKQEEFITTDRSLQVAFCRALCDALEARAARGERL